MFLWDSSFFSFFVEAFNDAMRYADSTYMVVEAFTGGKGMLAHLEDTSCLHKISSQITITAAPGSDSSARISRRVHPISSIIPQ